MGYRELQLRVPVGADDKGIEAEALKRAAVKSGTVRIIKKSLDCRRKQDIRWETLVGVSSPELKGGEEPAPPSLEPEYRKRDKRVLVIGTGPAGIFAADYLSRAGFGVFVLERGPRVETRRDAIASFELRGPFPDSANYAFGEGGAGTFSDGKLSSRTKGIQPKREYLFRRFVESGAPPEIQAMAHPHVGSDNLFTITRNMRASLEARGAAFMFGQAATAFRSKGGRIAGVETPAGLIEADYVVVACGHSAHDTQRALMAAGLNYRVKDFAVGFRAEHRQELINRAQWGRPSLPGVKAAEYRLATQADGRGVYSFCMCPGGTIVPASAFAGTAVVNGKSDWARDGSMANAAVVAALSLPGLLGRELQAAEALDWLEELEASYYRAAGSYSACAMTIGDFLAGRSGSALPRSTYPLGLVPWDLAELLPPALVPALRAGLQDFCKKLKGYDTGILVGLESKTSSPVQVERGPDCLAAGFENLYVCGEGSGFSGGIVSSAADGLRAAEAIAALP